MRDIPRAKIAWSWEGERAHEKKDTYLKNRSGWIT